jgi:heterodisulfide reductase subunit C
MENQSKLRKEKASYQKPLFEKQKEMTFPKEIMEQLNGGRFCLQCSSCHGCS